MEKIGAGAEKNTDHNNKKKRSEIRQSGKSFLNVF